LSLEPISKSFEEDHEAGKLDEADEIVGVVPTFTSIGILAMKGFFLANSFPRLRPRFIGLVEFGPGNMLYHEDRKHHIASVILPADGIEVRLIRAKSCNSCG
jgi:hypothetical protein